MLNEMKKVGREVLFLRTNEQNCRNGEGAFIRLKDGSILFAYTEFLKGLGHDSDVSRISGVVSYDEGETWTDKRVLLEPSDGALNIMSVSLFRRSDGSLCLVHGEKYMDDDGIITNRKFMKISYDEGKTWSENIRCYGRDGYAVLNNDRVLRLKSGRLIIPIAHHNDDGINNTDHKIKPGFLTFSISDDDGKTWRSPKAELHSPYSDSTGFQEPGIYQHEDGTLWLWCRTLLGSQFMSYSKDDGETWTNPEPSLFFTSPRSPMSVKKLGDYTVAVFNPIPTFTGRNPERGPWGRSPLVCAVSSNDGITHDAESFDKIFYLEDDLSESYCYTALFAGNDYFLAAYYHTGGSGWCLSNTKMVKVFFDELK